MVGVILTPPPKKKRCFSSSLRKEKGIPLAEVVDALVLYGNQLDRTT